MIKYKNLEKALDSIFGIFSDDKKAKIINAVEKDFKQLSVVSDSGNTSQILDMFNDIFSKRSKVISRKVSSKYDEILKYYTIDEIKSAMTNARDDEFHKGNNYKYCTLEYFSRLEQIDKWINVKQVKENTTFIAPKFYTKE